MSPIVRRQHVSASGLAVASAVRSPFMSAAISSAPCGWRSLRPPWRSCWCPQPPSPRPRPGRSKSVHSPSYSPSPVVVPTGRRPAALCVTDCFHALALSSENLTSGNVPVSITQRLTGLRASRLVGNRVSSVNLSRSGLVDACPAFARYLDCRSLLCSVRGPARLRRTPATLSAIFRIGRRPSREEVASASPRSKRGETRWRRALRTPSRRDSPRNGAEPAGGRRYGRWPMSFAGLPRQREPAGVISPFIRNESGSRWVPSPMVTP